MCGGGGFTSLKSSDVHVQINQPFNVLNINQPFNDVLNINQPIFMYVLNINTSIFIYVLNINQPFSCMSSI